MIKQIIQFSIFLALGVLLVWLITKDLTPEQSEMIWTSIQQADYIWVILALFAGLASHISRSIRWNMLMRPLGINVRTPVTIYAVLIGYLANLAFPRLGDISRCGIIARYEGAKVEQVIGTMVAERLFDVIMLLLLCITTVLVQFDFIFGYFQTEILVGLEAKFGNIILPLSIVGVVSCILFFILRKKIWQAIQRFKKLANFIQNLQEGLTSVRKLKNPIQFILHTLFIWAMYLCMVWLIFFSFPETAHLSILAGLTLMVLGSFGIIVTPGGIGAYQIIVSSAMIALYAISDEISLAFAWVTWASQTLMIILFGFISFIGLSFYQKRSNDTSKSSI